MSLEIYEYTDIGSVTAWVAEPVLRRVRRRYEGVAWLKRVYGSAEVRPGVAPEPERARWVAVAAAGRAPVTARLERLPASPLLVSRAARAAEHQGRARAEAVLRRLREAIFVDGRPADTVERIRAAVAGVPGLDAYRLIRDLESPDVVWSVGADRAAAHRARPGLAAGDGLPCAFPTLVVRGPLGERIVAGTRPYEAYVAAIEAVAPLAHAVQELPFDVDEALEHHRSLTAGDLRGAEPPAHAVRVQTATAPLWLHPDEAAARALGVAAVAV